MTILFLDFDGVLHHENVRLDRTGRCAEQALNDNERRYLTDTGFIVQGENLFGHCERLVSVLEPYPDLQVVISSTWREHFQLEALLNFMPSALAERVVGQTPHIDRIGGVGSRLQEVVAYLEGNSLDRNWVALDDQAQLFWDETEDFPDNLFLCPGTGLTEAVADAFWQWLRKRMEDV